MEATTLRRSATMGVLMSMVSHGGEISLSWDRVRGVATMASPMASRSERHASTSSLGWLVLACAGRFS